MTPKRGKKVRKSTARTQIDGKSHFQKKIRLRRSPWSLTVQNGESRVDADPTEPPTNVAATLPHRRYNRTPSQEHFFFAHKPFKLTRE